MLLFFAAMFIMIEAAVELGLVSKISQLHQVIIDTAPQSARKVTLGATKARSGGKAEQGTRATSEG